MSSAGFSMVASADGEPPPPLISPRPIGVPSSPSGGSEPPSGRPHIGAWLFILLFLAALIAGGYFLFSAALRLFPEAAEEEDPPPPAEAAQDPAPRERDPLAEPEETPPRPPPQPPRDSALQRAERQRAEELLLEVLTLRQTLDTGGAEMWGGAAFADARRFSDAADEALLREDYLDAAENYRRALRRLESVEARMPEAFETLLREGRAALARTDGDAARRYFDAARRIDPQHAEAEQGYRRAQTVEQVASLVRAGEGKEAAGRLPLALADFQEALRLDPLSEEAAAGVQRISVEIRQAEFRELMSQGLVALRAGQLDRAEQLIRQARDIEPDATAVREAMQQVDEARKAQRIRELDVAARAAETREDWASARRDYAEILDINPLIRSAQEGRDRAAERLHVIAEMNHFLEDADRLTTPEGRDRGLRAKAMGERLGPAGPAWNEKFEKFEALVARATAPVRVTIQSDGQTSVDIFRVGRLGRVTSREILLAPGTYTVVGHRPGFRDTRLTLTVPVGGEPFAFEVISRDPIR